MREVKLFNVFDKKQEEFIYNQKDIIEKQMDMLSQWNVIVDNIMVQFLSTLIYIRNGSGKTTIINLLTRMCEPSSGKILLGTENISELSLPEYRNMVAVVSQHELKIMMEKAD